MHSLMQKMWNNLHLTVDTNIVPVFVIRYGGAVHINHA